MNGRLLSRLQFSEPAKFQTETVEYSMRGPLYAASAVLSRRVLSADRRLLECRARVQYPIRKNKEFELRAETEANGVLLWQEEIDLTTGTKKLWQRTSTNEYECDGLRTFIADGSVQSIIGLFFALTDHLSAGRCADVDPVFVVVGRNIWRVDWPVATTLEASRFLVNDGRQRERYRIDFEWDPQANLIRELSIGLPFFGRLRAHAAGYQRQ